MQLYGEQEYVAAALSQRARQQGVQQLGAPWPVTSGETGKPPARPAVQDLHPVAPEQSDPVIAPGEQVQLPEVADDDVAVVQQCRPRSEDDQCGNVAGNSVLSSRTRP
jgi:hypothetical protein